MIAQTHPLYADMLDNWQISRDSYAGEKIVKSLGVKYLPATSGQIADGYGREGTIGEAAYQAYKMRAVYPHIYQEAVQSAIGIMHRKPPIIELPSVLEDMRNNASRLCESIEMLLRRVNTRQLITGRIGVLGDVLNENGIVKPVLVTYDDLSILNWDDQSAERDSVDLRLVLLDESGYQMDNNNLSWAFKDKYRLLALAGDQGRLSAVGTYGSALIDELHNLNGIDLNTHHVMGQKLNAIPFAFINSKDISPAPDQPPLLGLANLCMTIYRGEADYRQNLFMQGQDTLVRIGAQAGAEETTRTGAGARIDVPIGGDAKYIGVSSNGLSEQRQSLQNDYAGATHKGGQLLDATSRSKESGDALKVRVSAQTANLPQIAKAGAKGIEKVLKLIAQWFGANPDEVSIKPNLDFTGADLDGQTLVQMMQAKGLNAPLSDESIHEWLQSQGVTEQTYQAEMERIENEAPRL